MYNMTITDTYGLTDYCVEMGYKFQYVDGNNGYEDELEILVPFAPTTQNVFQFAIDYSRWFFVSDLNDN